MNAWKGIALSLALLIGGAAFVSAEEKTAAEPAKPEKKEAKAPAKKIRLQKPFSLLTSLTDDQKEKINELEERLQAAIQKLTEEKNAEARALLTDAQKQELDTAVEKNEAEIKAKKAGMKKEEPKKEEKAEEKM